MQMTSTHEHLRVLRVAVVEGVHNGCSMLYGAVWKAARALGAKRMDTHTHNDEFGGSLRAAGWLHGGWTTGGTWDCPSRRRSAPVDSLPKQRWWTPGPQMPDGTILHTQRRPRAIASVEDL